MNTLIHRSFVPAFIFGVALFASPMARADQPAMHQARTLTNQAIELLRNDATAGKGGHRVAALKLLQQAVDQLNAGIEYDRTHLTRDEVKPRR